MLENTKKRKKTASSNPNHIEAHDARAGMGEERAKKRVKKRAEERPLDRSLSAPSTESTKIKSGLQRALSCHDADIEGDSEFQRAVFSLSNLVNDEQINQNRFIFSRFLKLKEESLETIREVLNHNSADGKAIFYVKDRTTQNQTFRLIKESPKIVGILTENPYLMTAKKNLGIFNEDRSLTNTQLNTLLIAPGNLDKLLTAVFSGAHFDEFTNEYSGEVQLPKCSNNNNMFSRIVDYDIDLLAQAIEKYLKSKIIANSITITAVGIEYINNFWFNNTPGITARALFGLFLMHYLNIVGGKATKWLQLAFNALISKVGLVKKTRDDLIDDIKEGIRGVIQYNIRTLNTGSDQSDNEKITIDKTIDSIHEMLKSGGVNGDILSAVKKMKNDINDINDITPGPRPGVGGGRTRMGMGPKRTKKVKSKMSKGKSNKHLKKLETEKKVGKKNRFHSTSKKSKKNTRKSR